MMLRTPASGLLALGASLLILGFLAGCNGDGSRQPPDPVDRSLPYGSHLLLIIDANDPLAFMPNMTKSVHVLNPYGFPVKFTPQLNNPVRFQLLSSAGEAGCGPSDPSKPITLPAWGCCVITIEYVGGVAVTNRRLSLVSDSGTIYAWIGMNGRLP